MSILSAARKHPFLWVVWVATPCTLAIFAWATWSLLAHPRPVSDFGWTQVRDSVADLARRSRLRLGTAVVAQPGHGTTRLKRLKRLTDRELEVLRLIAQGMSNDENGATLFISPRTASVHVSRILAKLEVTTRAKATAVAYDEGLFAEGAGADAHRA